MCQQEHQQPHLPKMHQAKPPLRYPRLTFIGLALLIFGCAITPKKSYSLPSQPTAEVILISAPLNPAPSLTPFQPLPVTPTSDKPIFPTPTPTSTPKPVLPTSTPLKNNWAGVISPAIPPPAPLFKQPPNQVNILLMGSDQRPNDGGFRTDAIILITINLDNNTVNMTSFPRDLYVYIPGWGMERINTAQFRGGFALTSAMFEYNFGVRPDHYAMIKFDGFEDLIDTLSGIDVQVAKKLTDQRTGYGYYTVSPGQVHMDGETALWYSRSRYSSSDFDRVVRQQEVLRGLYYKLISWDVVSKFPDYYDVLLKTIQTDMSLDELLVLVPLAPLFVDGDKINHFSIGPQHVSSWVTYTGAQVLLPNKDAIRKLLKTALNIP